MMLLIFFTNRTSLSPLRVKNDITLGTALRGLFRIQPCIAPNALKSWMYVLLPAILDSCISTPPGEFWFPPRGGHCILCLDLTNYMIKVMFSVYYYLYVLEVRKYE
jgi:hypothetical protein